MCCQYKPYRKVRKLELPEYNAYLTLCIFSHGWADSMIWYFEDYHGEYDRDFPIFSYNNIDAAKSGGFLPEIEGDTITFFYTNGAFKFTQYVDRFEKYYIQSELIQKDQYLAKMGISIEYQNQLKAQSDSLVKAQKQIKKDFQE